MNNRKNFIPLIFKNAYIVGGFNYLIKQGPGFQDEPPCWFITIVVHNNNEALQTLQQTVLKYREEGLVRSNASDLVKSFDVNRFEQEATVFLNEGKDCSRFSTLKIKSKTIAPLLASPLNHTLPAVPENEKFFSRGVQVNVRASLGINKGQPFMILKAVQYVGEGFSNKLIIDTVTEGFEKIPGAVMPQGMVTTHIIELTDDEQQIALASGDDEIPF